MNDIDNIKNSPIPKDVIPAQGICKCHCDFCTALDHMEAAFPAGTRTEKQGLALSEFTDLLMRALDDLDEANEILDGYDWEDEDLEGNEESN